MRRAFGPPSPSQMLRFDLSRGLPLALGLLRRHLGAVGAAWRLGRPELARRFCAADARYIGSEASPVTLERPQTLAAGAPACGFRFEVRPGRLPVV